MVRVHSCGRWGEVESWFAFNVHRKSALHNVNMEIFLVSSIRDAVFEVSMLLYLAFWEVCTKGKKGVILKVMKGLMYSVQFLPPRYQN